MKISKVFKVLPLAAITLFVASCDTDAADEANELAGIPTATELKLAAQADNVEDQSFSVVENAYVETEEEGRSSQNSFFSSCATLTVTPNGDGTGSILVDFGTGCTLNNGAEVSGQVAITYGVIQNASRTITYTYQDFTYNGNEVSGGGTVNRQLENGNGNPQSDLLGSVEVYFPQEDVTATRTVNRTREWIEGFGSGTWTDNVVLVTGDWNTSFSSGFNRSGEVTSALRREAACPHFVSGILDITQNNINGTLDFGDGTCDNVAIATVLGQEYTIQL